MLQFSGSGDRLIGVGYDRAARLWDADSGEEIAALQPPPGTGRFSFDTPLTLSADGRWALLTVELGSEADHHLRLWDLESGGPHDLGQVSGMPTAAVALSPDGSRIAFGDAQTIRIFEVPPLETGSSPLEKRSAVHPSPR
jgi:WD40 repeat protein